MKKIDFEAMRISYDLLDYVEKHFTVKYDGTNRAKILCPYHDESTPSLVIYPKTQSWYCFGCARMGDVFDLMELAEGRRLKEFIASLGENGIDFSLWRKQLNKQYQDLEIDSLYMLGSMSLRSLSGDRDYKELCASLEDATFSLYEMERVVAIIVSKASVKTAV